MSLLNLTPDMNRSAVTSKLSKIFQLYFAALFDWGCKGMCCLYSNKIFLLFFKSFLPLLKLRKYWDYWFFLRRTAKIQLDVFLTNFFALIYSHSNHTAQLLLLKELRFFTQAGGKDNQPKLTTKFI
jgi:hypothetical protein